MGGVCCSGFFGRLSLLRKKSEQNEHHRTGNRLRQEKQITRKRKLKMWKDGKFNFTKLSKLSKVFWKQKRGSISYSAGNLFKFCCRASTEYQEAVSD